MCACMCVCVCVLSCVCVGNIITYTIQRSKANQIFPPSGEVGFGTLRWESTEIATYTHIRVCVCTCAVSVRLSGWVGCLLICMRSTYLCAASFCCARTAQTNIKGSWGVTVSRNVCTATGLRPIRRMK